MSFIRALYNSSAVKLHLNSNLLIPLHLVLVGHACILLTRKQNAHIFRIYTLIPSLPPSPTCIALGSEKKMYEDAGSDSFACLPFFLVPLYLLRGPVHRPPVS